MSSSAEQAPHGVLVVDKPQGPTSFDMVARARRVFSTRRVGHAGTLDPMATGVLVLLIGEATKLSNHLASAEKSYRATVEFGSSTDTLDADGTVTHAAPVPEIPERELEQALHNELQRRLQTPPSYSAIKISGKAAHRLARAGRDVRLPERPVQVRRLELLSLTTSRVEIRLDVSKGYYVRAFARDLCRQLGVPGHLSALRRLRSGCFTLDEASALSDAAPAQLLPLGDSARRSLHWVRLSALGAERARHGKVLTPEHFDPACPRRFGAWLDQHGRLVALGEPTGEPVGTEFRVRRGFNT